MFSCDKKDKQLFVYFVKRMIGETPDILGLFFMRILTERSSPWEKNIQQLNPRQKLTYQKYSRFYQLAECFLHSAYNYIFIPCSKNFHSLQRVFRVRAGVFHHCLHKWDLSRPIRELVTGDDFSRNQGLFLPLLYRQRNVSCPWLYGSMNAGASSCPHASLQQVKRYFRSKNTLLKLYPQISHHRVTRTPWHHSVGLPTLCDGLQSRNTNDRSWQGIPPTIKLLSSCMCNDPPADVLLKRYLRHSIGRKHLRSKIAGDILQADNRIIISRCLWNFVILLGNKVFPKLRSPIVWNSDGGGKLHPLPHVRRRKLPHQYPASVVWGGVTHFDYWREPWLPDAHVADPKHIQEKINKLQLSFPEVLKTYLKIESYETGRETGKDPAEMLQHVKEWEKAYTSVWKVHYYVSDLPAVSHLPSQDPIKVIEIHDILSHYIVNFI
jgi:hypothetical protein